MAGNFPPSALAWVKDPATTWSGPVHILPSQIDTADKDQWDAHIDKAKVTRIKARYKRTGKTKPIVVVRAPDHDTDLVADGHHHLLAALDLGIPVKAYVAHVAHRKGPWQTLSLRQRRGGAKESVTGRLTKDEAGYAPAESPGMRCGTCVMWDDGRCSLVQGDIDPGFVCSQWQAKGSEGAVA
jgi:hypothetical protein